MKLDLNVNELSALIESLEELEKILEKIKWHVIMSIKT